MSTIYKDIIIGISILFICAIMASIAMLTKYYLLDSQERQASNWLNSVYESIFSESTNFTLMEAEKPHISQQGTLNCIYGNATLTYQANTSYEEVISLYSMYLKNDGWSKNLDEEDTIVFYIPDNDLLKSISISPIDTSNQATPIYKITFIYAEIRCLAKPPSWQEN